MNPGTNWAGYRPLFRLTVVAKADKVNGEYRFWYYTRLIFKNLDTGSQHINFCTKSTPMQVNYDSTLESRNFNLFDRFSPEDRRNFELLVPGEYQLIIEAYNQARQCDRWLWSISPRTTVDGILRILPFQAISAVSINGGSKLGLHPGDKFDLNFTVENNRASNQEAGGSASIGRVEWLIASSRPASTNTNIAAGMNCATPNPVSGNFSGRYSSKLLDVISVPQDADFGIYNLYLRVHDRNSSATCSTDGAITPLYIMHGAISVEPAVRSIKISPALPQPQPPIAVGMHDITMNWEVKFSNSVTGVDAKHFRLVSTGFALAPALTSLSGSGNLYHVTTVVPAGSITPDKQASLRLDFIDDDSVRTVPSERPIGGPGIGNGNFTGETYALMGTICGAANTIWCDDFERTVQGESGPGAISRSGMVGNGWTVESAHSACTSQMPSNNAQPDAGGCAGIDSDIKPYREYGASLRANRGRSMFNRWQQHSVTSKQIDLSGLPANSAVELAYWLRRGDDSFASVPQSKHAHIHTEYLDKTGTWQTLAYHRSATSRGTPGEILRPIFQLPEDALWQGFRLRFTQPEGRGFGDNSDPKRVNGYDYWFIDDVSLRRVDAPRYAGGFCDNFEAPTASLKQWSF
ncbi:MAG: hypothetical protein LBI68_07880, partial [Azoarcus sp.]|nr:hypothetical protein [Azoarcus sp.]